MLDCVDSFRSTQLLAKDCRAQVAEIRVHIDKLQFRKKLHVLDILKNYQIQSAKSRKNASDSTRNSC